MKRRKFRFDGFDDWREWFGPRPYGFGWTARTWKGALAAGLVICAAIAASIVLTHVFA
jgi:hypothetical protein